MHSALNIADLAREAQVKLPAMAWEYLDSAAGDEWSKRWNESAFDTLKLWPRVLADVSLVDPAVHLLGETLTHPILLAPVAYHRLFHPVGERETARGAMVSNSIYCVSTMTNTSIEAIVRDVPEAKLWYQLYVQRDREYTRNLIQRVEAAGVRALVVTVDTPVLGNRVRETKAGFHLPEGLTRAMLEGLPAELQISGHAMDQTDIYYPLCDPRLSWADIEWMCKTAKVPVVLKGILHPADAEKAVHSGAAAIIVSNHGGRNLDTVPATLEVLPQIVKQVDRRLPVLLDGGIRRGTDILKAVALGANAVLIGRPYVWGLAAGGSEGVMRSVDILVKEFRIAMALCGCQTVGQISDSLLFPGG